MTNLLHLSSLLLLMFLWIDWLAGADKLCLEVLIGCCADRLLVLRDLWTGRLQSDLLPGHSIIDLLTRTIHCHHCWLQCRQNPFPHLTLS